MTASASPCPKTGYGRRSTIPGYSKVHSRMSEPRNVHPERDDGHCRVQGRPGEATFGGKVTLSELDPPNSYRISGEGSGGVAGFAKGGAETVKLQFGRS